MEGRADFSICNNGNFQFTFPNGYQLSVGIGSGHYCNNKSLEDKDLEKFGCLLNPFEKFKSNTCEIQVFDKNDHTVTGWPGCPEGHQYYGWITIEDFHKVIAWIYQQS